MEQPVAGHGGRALGTAPARPATASRVTWWTGLGAVAGFALGIVIRIRRGYPREDGASRWTRQVLHVCALVMLTCMLATTVGRRTPVPATTLLPSLTHLVAVAILDLPSLRAVVGRMIERVRAEVASGRR
jgi:hypothetical protein